ncbi:glycosyltransferase [Alicyclobacillaceae bacterium I2511]|nr:glycosyltransferase [Alicyclobacillaceae bacterium I2511]
MEVAWMSGGLTLLAWLVLGGLALPGLLRMPLLDSQSLERLPTRESADTLPPVSVILAARNEAAAIADTLYTLRQQTWPNLEVIAVNDRSTDATWDIMKEAASNWPELKIHNITELPPGWLGKNYALQQASAMATGQWLLFTDADVVFSPAAVETAVLYAQFHGLDHLAVAPGLFLTGFWLRVTVYFFVYNIMLAFRPQDANRPDSPKSVGIGAFNLMRQPVYNQVGGHAAVALRPDEDLALGACIKSAGFRQSFAGGAGLVQVQWYAHLADMARGLEKNALAPFQYKWGRFIWGMVGALLFYMLPALGTLLSPGFSRLPFAGALVLSWLLFILGTRGAGVAPGWALSIPLGAPILFSILIRSAWLTARRGGIVWRGTFYSLTDLRRQSS